MAYKPDLISKAELNSGELDAKIKISQIVTKLVIPVSPGAPTEIGTIKVDSSDGRIKWVDEAGKIISNGSIIKSLELNPRAMDWGGASAIANGNGVSIMAVPSSNRDKIARNNFTKPIDLNDDSNCCFIMTLSGSDVSLTAPLKLYASFSFLGEGDSVTSSFNIIDLEPSCGWKYPAAANSLLLYRYLIPKQILAGKKLILVSLKRKASDGYSGIISVYTTTLRYESLPNDINISA